MSRNKVTVADSSTIDLFRGPYAFLSNFYVLPNPSTMIVRGISFPSLEAAYQAQKTNNPDLWYVLSDPAMTPAAAKLFGSKIKLDYPDWDIRRIRVMLELVIKKFRDPKLRALLSSTSPKVLIEGNHHGDDFWGKVHKTGPGNTPMLVGRNWLGSHLMAVRDAEGKIDRGEYLRRASGNAVCRYCGGDYFSHPMIDDVLHLLYSGEAAKL